MDTSLVAPEMQTGIQLLQHPLWSRLGWLAHGFTTRTGGLSRVYSADGSGELNLGFTPADDREVVLQNRALLLRALPGGDTPGTQLTVLSQVHSPTIHIVRETGEVPPGDGMVTAKPGMYLAIQTADCVPVLLVDEKRRVVAAIHAGWRGTVKRIVEAGIETMQQEFGTHPADASALIGPAIGPCCYAVGEELHGEFTAAFPYGSELFTSKRVGGENKLHLDLGEANRRQLLESGLKQENIHQLGGCTNCQPERYFSHRQSHGNTGRLMSVVGIRAE